MAKRKSTTSRKRKTRKPPQLKLLSSRETAIHHTRLASVLGQLEPLICDLDRWARISRMMCFHDLENIKEPVELLGLEVVEHVERLAGELKAAFDKGVEEARP